MVRPMLMHGTTRNALSDAIAGAHQSMQPGEVIDLVRNGARLRYARIDWAPEKPRKSDAEKEREGTWKRGLPTGKTHRKRMSKLRRSKQSESASKQPLPLKAHSA